jgi:hypothetical protein
LASPKVPFLDIRVTSNQIDVLKSELEQVRSQLAAAEVEYASLGAKISGLRAHAEALNQALSGAGSHSDKVSRGKPRTEAIVDVLKEADAEMTIKDVIAALHDSGRDQESYDNVGVDMAYLADRGRIVRLRRGVYSRPDRIVIPLTAGSLNNNYIAVGDHLGFFPADAVGAANADNGEGVMLTLHYAGLPDPVETDIAGSPHLDFRRRGSIRKFFEHHKLQPGDEIAIEKISDYEYRVVPVR